MSPEPTPWCEKTTVRRGKKRKLSLNQKADLSQPRGAKAGKQEMLEEVLPCSGVQFAQEVWPPRKAGKGSLALSAPST